MLNRNVRVLNRLPELLLSAFYIRFPNLEGRYVVTG